MRASSSLWIHTATAAEEAALALSLLPMPMLPSLFLSANRSGCASSSRIRFHRLFSNAVITPSADPDPTYVNLRNAPGGFDAASAVVYPGFLSEVEGKSLIKEVGQRMKRRRFENGHWDSVITGYREVELPDEQFSSSPCVADENIAFQVVRKTRRHLEKRHVNGDYTGAISYIRWLPCHAIDLSTEGELSAHVDSVKFSGGIVAGLSLLSDAIMRLRPSSSDWESGDNASIHSCDIGHHGYVDLFLPQLSLYVLSGMSRYEYTHELLPSGTRFEFVNVQDDSIEGHSIDVIRGRRLSIIFRDSKSN